MEKMFRWANVALAILTLLAYTAPYLSPTRFSPVAMLAPLYPLLALGHVAFILWWLLRRKAYALLSLACLLGGWPHLTAHLNLSRARAPQTKEATLLVLTYNCHGFRDYHRQNAKVPPQAAADFFRKYQADVVCLQEFPSKGRTADEYVAALTEQGGFTHHYILPWGGLAIFSRHPIGDRGGRYFENKSNGFLFVDVQVGAREVRIFNAHLQTNAVTRMADEVAIEGNFRERDTWLTVRGMFSRYRRAAATRAEQAREIKAKIQESPAPTILCGDFNDVPLSHTYATLAKGLQDGFQQVGRGLAATYTGNLPGLRIDYVLADPSLRLLDYRTSRTGPSDHYPVLCRVGLP